MWIDGQTIRPSVQKLFCLWNLECLLKFLTLKFAVIWILEILLSTEFVITLFTNWLWFVFGIFHSASFLPVFIFIWCSTPCNIILCIKLILKDCGLANQRIVSEWRIIDDFYDNGINTRVLTTKLYVFPFKWMCLLWHISDRLFLKFIGLAEELPVVL